MNKIKNSDNELFKLLYGMYMYDSFQVRNFDDINNAIEDMEFTSDMRQSLYYLGVIPKREYDKKDWENGIVLQDIQRFFVRNGGLSLHIPKAVLFCCWLVNTLRTKVLTLECSVFLLDILGVTLRELLEAMPKDDMEVQLELLGKVSFSGYFYQLYSSKADELFGNCINPVLIHLVKDGLNNGLKPTDFKQVGTDVYEVCSSIRLIVTKEGTNIVKATRGY